MKIDRYDSTDRQEDCINNEVKTYVIVLLILSKNISNITPKKILKKKDLKCIILCREWNSKTMRILFSIFFLPGDFVLYFLSIMLQKQNFAAPTNKNPLKSDNSW